ncbi:MAG: hypothetical protein ABWZ15_14835 [Acidimicrobiia bacterium]
MRTRRTAVLLVIGVLTVTGCSGDDDSDDLGPQPTNEDPGPNDTSTGPTTVQGVLTIGTDPECLTLALPEGPVALDLDDYSIADDAGQPALVADDDGRVLAHSGDTLVVSGRADSAATDACGPVFTVESLNSVIPTP